ncbi:MAG: glycosyltransferase [Proteobacteria bacterium]|nr:glycosyltransferase [Pseudomonadota bacterium]
MRGAICIVSPGNLASNPRLLKEADALHGAGYAVTAVVCRYTEELRSFDEAIAAEVPWKVVGVRRDATEGIVARAASAAVRALESARLPVPVAMAAAAYGGPSAPLRRAAARVPADLYIAHYVAGLAAAGAVARQAGARLGFDAEDYHAGEGTPLQQRMVRRIDRSYLPGCSHVTAAAPMIGAGYARDFGVRPVTVLNVFPLAMAPAAPRPPAAPGPLRAYWFSQTIGPDRGLQSFIEAMALVRRPVTLDIRGSNRWGHGDRLLALARERGIADRVRLLPTAPPEDMVRLAAEYDIGLSLETDVSENRRVCLTNKIFTYLLAGVPVVLSETPAQRALAPELGAAARLVSLADPPAIAATLDALAESPDAVAGARAEAWRLGQERYNWEFEKKALLDSVERALGGPGVAA